MPPINLYELGFDKVYIKIINSSNYISIRLFFVQLSDTVMVGQIGSRNLAAISFGGNVYFFIYIFGIGIVSGLVTIIGEVYSNFHLSRTLLHNAIVLFTILGFM